MLLSFNWIIALNWIIRSHKTLQAKWKGNALLSSVVTSMLSILSIFLQYIPIQTFFVLSEYWEKRVKKRTRFSTLRAPALCVQNLRSIISSHWVSTTQKSFINKIFLTMKTATASAFKHVLWSNYHLWNFFFKSTFLISWSNRQQQSFS